MNLKIKLIKYLDLLIGNLLSFCCRIIPTRERSYNISLGNENAVQDTLKILVIRPGGIGDMVLLFPMFMTLKEKFPNSVIDVLGEKRNYGILDLCSDVNKVLLYDSKPFNTFYEIYKSKYDIVIDTEQWHKLTSVVCYLSRAPIRIGFNTNGRSTLYSHTADYKHSDYEVDSFLKLVGILTAKKYQFNNESKFINPPTIYRNHNLNDFELFKNKHRKLLGVFSGATIRERRWGAENFAYVAKKIIDKNIGVVILGAKAEISDSKIFSTIIGKGNYLDLTAKTTLKETTEVISKLDAFLSADSGLMHIAYGLGIRTISLFGAGIKPKWAPRGTKSIIIDMQLPCSPCTKFGYTTKCSIDVKCLKDITTDQVYNACSHVLYDDYQE